ncbi:MAG: ABC transporter permease, partial [Ilumatobacteraceae bacterium]
MAGYIVKRFLNTLLLVFIAASAGYFLASTALSPRSNFELANPPIPEETIDIYLNAANVNDKVPVIERYLNWIPGVLTWDLGVDLDGHSINDEFSRRVWVSLRLLI